MKIENIELMATVLKGNIAALEMMNTNEYIELEQTDRFQGYTFNNLGQVISDLSEILNALEGIQKSNQNYSDDILSVAYATLGFSL